MNDDVVEARLRDGQRLVTEVQNSLAEQARRDALASASTSGRSRCRSPPTPRGTYRR